MLRRDSADLDEIIEAGIMTGTIPGRHSSDDAPLSFGAGDLSCPELHGRYTVSEEFRSRSEKFTVKTLRSGDRAEGTRLPPPDPKNLYVTRRLIKEWLQACQDRGTLTPRVFKLAKARYDSAGKLKSRAYWFIYDEGQAGPPTVPEWGFTISVELGEGDSVEAEKQREGLRHPEIRRRPEQAEEGGAHSSRGDADRGRDRLLQHQDGAALRADRGKPSRQAPGRTRLLFRMGALLATGA